MTRTRIVRWLRVLLPLLALLILSTMFLFSSRPASGPDDGAASGQEHLMLMPQYSGVTSDGAELSLRASRASPIDEGTVTARDLVLDWQAQSGLSAQLTAPDGMIENERIMLRGGVRMTTSSGWQMDAPNVDAATDRSDLIATGGVKADAPLGHLTAERMQMLPDARFAPGPDAPSVLNFTGKVHLIYLP